MFKIIDKDCIVALDSILGEDNLQRYGSSHQSPALWNGGHMYLRDGLNVPGAW